jgi:hypothetical protein
MTFLFLEFGISFGENWAQDRNTFLSNLQL